MGERHTIKLQDLQEWMKKDGWSDFATSFGNGSNKKLEVSVSGQFRVSQSKEVIYFGTSAADAIGVYNAAP